MNNDSLKFSKLLHSLPLSIPFSLTALRYIFLVKMCLPNWYCIISILFICLQLITLMCSISFGWKNSLSAVLTTSLGLYLVYCSFFCSKNLCKHNCHFLLKLLGVVLVLLKNDFLLHHFVTVFLSSIQLALLFCKTGFSRRFLIFSINLPVKTTPLKEYLLYLLLFFFSKLSKKLLRTCFHHRSQLILFFFLRKSTCFWKNPSFLVPFCFWM